MAKVQNSLPGAAEDERVLKALSDTNLMKYASKSKYRQANSNVDDYKNAKFKVLQYREEKTERIERESKKKTDEKSKPRRRRRKSTGSTDRRRRKADTEKERKKAEEIIPVTDDDDFEPQLTHLDPMPQKIKHNTLSSYFSSPHEEGSSKQIRRSCRSIDTSSTQKTKKQSNSSGPKTLSVNDLVNNSAWATERIRRTPRNPRMRDKMDNHYISTPSSNGTTRKNFRKYRSENDVSALNRPDSASRSKPRRKYRSNMSRSIDAISNNATFPASPITPRAPGVATSKLTNSTSKKTTYITDPGLITPYTVPPEQGTSTPRSYSDRVMVAAESSKTPMANLKKYLKEEKMFSTSEYASTTSGPKETMSVGRKPKKLSNSLLQIPFSDGTSNTSEIRDENTGNKAAPLSIQSFGKSVAKSMKRQAQNTKRQIGRQINKLTTSNKATESRNSPTSPLRDVKPPSGLFTDENDSITLSSPVDTVKPPSGKISTATAALHALHPPLGHSPRQESDLPPQSEIKPKSDKKLGKKTKKKNRTKKKSRSKRKLLDEDSEVSFDGIMQSSAALGLDFYTAENMVSPPAQFPIFEEDAPEDSTIERSYRINPDIHTKLSDDVHSLKFDYDSSIDNGSKPTSPQNARRYVSSADSLISAKFSPKTENAMKNRPTTDDGDVQPNFVRKNNNSGSTTTTTASSPILTQSETEFQNKSASQSQIDNDNLGPNCSTIEEEEKEEQNEENNDSNGSQADAIEEKEAKKLMSIAVLPLHQDQNDIDGLVQQEEVQGNDVRESAAVNDQEVGEQEETEELDLSLELFALLKNNGKSKKKSRAKERKEATKKAIEEHKKELERLKRNHQQLMAMNITVEHDPLAVSEISLPPHILQQQSPSTTRETMKSENGTRNRIVGQHAKTSKENKSKNSRRGSKSKGRKKKKNGNGESLVSAVAAVEEKDDIAANIVNESNSQILNLRMMLLQSNPIFQPDGI